jgi:flagellar FliJ protein
MTRAKRLQPVQQIVEDQQRALARSLAAIEKRLNDAESKLGELERYRQEYETQFSMRAQSGIGVMDLRDYQAFLARLSEAVKQQQALVHRARADRDGERTRWREAATRAKALDHVVERWQNEERVLLDRKEQRESDERAQRKVGIS